MTNKRLYSFDFLRGAAILGIICVHRLHYSWTVMSSKTAIHQNFHGLNAIFIVFAITLFTMAGLFYLITGAVNAYSIFNRFSQRTITTGKIIRSGFFTGGWFIFLHLVQRTFFMNGFRTIDGQIPEYPIGMVTGRIVYHESVPFYWKQIVDSSTLSLIGMIVIFISLTLAVLFHNNGHLNHRRNLVILSGIGVAIALLSPFVIGLLRPIFEQSLMAGHYFTAALYGILVSRFGLLPYLSYGFFGAVIGLALAVGFESGVILKYLKNAIWIWLAVGLVGLGLVILLGERLPQKMLYISSAIICVELGLFLWFIYFSLRRWDFSVNRKDRRWDRLPTIQRFGLLAMTIYILEPVLAAVLTNIIILFIGRNWLDSEIGIIGLGVLCAICWNFLIRFWSRLNYAGSFEWFYIFFARKLHLKESQKLAASGH